MKKKATPASQKDRLMLMAETAADLMTANPVSISQDATVKEATAFLADKGFTAAPVIDAAGRPVGVLSSTDIVIHDREKVEYVPAVPEYYDMPELTERASDRKLRSGFQVENVDRTQVREIMTPVVYSVTPDTSAVRVVEDMLALKVHRLFVVETNGVLVGIISTIDVLRHLRCNAPQDNGE